ncbi:hypothetical protein ACFSKJ_00045 [Tabrizicola soli]|uniref:hypothetical protein n=1 Tax=Tabrizicola soli TaxID=2185115 RepID=UPI00363D86D3
MSAGTKTFSIRTEFDPEPCIPTMSPQSGSTSNWPRGIKAVTDFALPYLPSAPAIPAIMNEACGPPEAKCQTPSMR